MTAETPDNDTPENRDLNRDRTAAASDVLLMPQGTAIISQQSAGMARGITLSALVDLYAPNPEGPDGAAEKNALKQNANKSTIALLDKIGNVRIDTVTFAATAGMDSDYGVGKKIRLMRDTDVDAVMVPA